MGKLLELGPKGDMVINYLVYLCNFHPLSFGKGLAGGKNGHCLHYWLPISTIYIFWGKFLALRPS